MSGKFDGNEDYYLAEYLHQLSLEGCDKELGDVQDFGWFGLILNIIKGNLSKGQSYIVHEDNYGFFDYRVYNTVKESEEEWARLEEDYEEFMKDSED